MHTRVTHETRYTLCLTGIVHVHVHVAQLVEDQPRMWHHLQHVHVFDGFESHPGQSVFSLKMTDGSGCIFKCVENPEHPEIFYIGAANVCLYSHTHMHVHTCATAEEVFSAQLYQYPPSPTDYLYMYMYIQCTLYDVCSRSRDHR